MRQDGYFTDFFIAKNSIDGNDSDFSACHRGGIYGYESKTWQGSVRYGLYTAHGAAADGGRFFLLLFFGKNHRVGAWFYRHGLSVVFSWNGAVIASAVVVFPLLYRTARSAFEQIDENLIYAGRTLGMSEWRIFWKIIFPNAVHGIAGGVVLAFARALGEFGATLMLAGNIPGKTQTAAIAVYSAMQNGNREDAYRWCLIMVLMSFAAILCLHLMTKKQVKKTGRN